VFFLGTEHSLHGANRKSPPAAAGHGQSLEPEGQRFGQGGRDCCVGAVRIYGLIEPLCCCMHGTPVRYVIPQIRKKKSLRRQGTLVVTRAGTTPCYLKTGHRMVFGTTWSTTRYKIFWAVPARHVHEGRTVSRISTRLATWLDPHLEPCLGRHGIKMVRRHFYNYTMQFSFVY
jgi:hypothetical protein